MTRLPPTQVQLIRDQLASSEFDLIPLLQQTLDQLRATGATRMPHVKTMHEPSKWLSAVDLQGKDATVTIESVVAGEVVGDGGKTTRMPIVSFNGKEKKLALNKTNTKTIIKMYGVMTEKWIGQAVTLWPTTTKLAGDTVECIRIRPTIPKAAP